MNALRRSALGIYFSSISQLLLSIVQGFVLVPVLLSKFGRELYGAWMAIAPILAWLTIMDPGFSDSIRANLARANGANDKREMGQIIGTWITLQVLIVPLPIIAGFLISPYVTQILALRPTYEAVVRTAFILTSVVAALFLLNGSLTGVMQGLHLGMTCTAIVAASNLIGLIATILLLFHGGSVEVIPEGMLIRVILSIACLAIFVWRFCQRNGIPFGVSIASISSSSIASIPVLVNKITSALFRNMDALSVSRLISVAAVPDLILTQRALDVVSPLLSGSSQALMPGLAHLAGDSRDDEFASLLQRLLRVNTWLLAFAGSAYIALNQSFVRLWVGQRFFGGQLLTILVFGTAALDTIYYIFFQASLASGLLRTAYLNGAALNLVRGVAVFAFTSAIGLPGVPLGAICANLIFVITLSRKLLVFRHRCRSIRVVLWDSAGSLALCAILGLLWSKVIPVPVSWSKLAAQVLAISSLSLILLCITDAVLRRLSRSLLLGLMSKSSRYANNTFRLFARATKVLPERH